MIGLFIITGISTAVLGFVLGYVVASKHKDSEILYERNLRRDFEFLVRASDREVARLNHLVAIHQMAMEKLQEEGKKETEVTDVQQHRKITVE